MFVNDEGRKMKHYLIALIVIFYALPSMSVDFSQEPSRLGSGQVTAIALSPDGTILAAWYDADGDWRTIEGELRLLDVQTKEQVGVLKKDLGWINSIAFSPDGKLLALGSSGNSGNKIHLWDVAGQNQVGEMQSPTRWGVFSVAFSPDGRTLASSGSGDSTVCLWDVQTQKQVGTLRGHTGQGINCVAFSPDGSLLFSGGHLGDEAIRIWDVQTKEQIGELIGSLGITMELEFSPDRVTLAQATGTINSRIYLWDIEAQNQVGVLGGNSHHVGSIAFSPDGKLLASTVYWDNTVHIWDIASREDVGVLKGHDATDFGWGDQVAISSDGKWLACGSENGVGLWELNLPGPIFQGCAYGPKPYNGTLHLDTWVTLSWTAGDFAVSHDVYLSDIFDDVNIGAAEAFRGNQISTFFVAGFVGFPYPDGLVPGTTYYWRIDEINDLHPDSPWKGSIWSFTIPPRKAYDPFPSDGAESVDPNVELSWTAGFGATVHTVYFGDSFDGVDNVTDGIRQAATTYAPGPLKPAKTYYWRIDEFSSGRDSETHKGDVWSFSTTGAVGNP
ncbi:WD40 repeat domain-containing protein [Planctomycetota bacterium]